MAEIKTNVKIVKINMLKETLDTSVNSQSLDNIRQSSWDILSFYETWLAEMNDTVETIAGQIIELNTFLDVIQNVRYWYI